MCTVSTLTTNFAKKGPLVTLATICAPVDKAFHLVKPFVLVFCHRAKIPEIINLKIEECCMLAHGAEVSVHDLLAPLLLGCGGAEHGGWDV